MSSLQELKEQARRLPVSDRLELVNDIIESLQAPSNPYPERTRIIKQMKGLLKTDHQLAPTDQEVEKILEERRVEKYIQ